MIKLSKSDYLKLVDSGAKKPNTNKQIQVTYIEKFKKRD